MGWMDTHSSSMLRVEMLTNREGLPAFPFTTEA
jgi:hypothetical protein